MIDHGRPAVLTAFERILVDPAPADLWDLQKALRGVDDPAAIRAMAVARAFHACLRELESKSASRRASRWGAVLGTAAVASVSVSEATGPRTEALERLLKTALPAALEVGAAVKSAEAWEVEAGLLYDDQAWFLSQELWDISVDARPDLSSADRGAEIDQVVDPLLDPNVPDGDRAVLVVEIFRAVLAARIASLLDGWSR